MFDKIIEKIKDKIAEGLIALVLILLSLAWLAIPSELKERYTDTTEKKFLLVVLGALILLVLSLFAWIYKLRKRLKTKDELSKDAQINSLQNQLQVSEATNKQLEDRIHELAPDFKPNEIQSRILFALDKRQQLDVFELEEIIGQPVENHLQELAIHQYVSSPSGVMYPKTYKLLKNGRDFVTRNKGK